MHHPLHVPGGEVINPETLAHGVGQLVCYARRCRGHTCRAHVVQQTTDPGRNQIRAQRPGCVDIPEGVHHVGNVGTHHALVGPLVGKVDRLAVEGKFSAAKQDQFQARGTDNDVGVEMRTGYQLHTVFRDLLNVIGHYRGLA